MSGGSCRVCKKSFFRLIKGLCRKHYKLEWQKGRKKRDTYYSARFEHVLAQLPERLFDKWINLKTIMEHCSNITMGHLSAVLNRAVKSGRPVKKKKMGGAILYLINHEIRKYDVRCRCGLWADFPVLKICKECYDLKVELKKQNSELEKNHKLANKKIDEIIALLPQGYLSRWKQSVHIVAQLNNGMVARTIGKLFSHAVLRGYLLEKEVTPVGIYFRRKEVDYENKM